MNRQVRRRPQAQRALSPTQRRWRAWSRDESGSVAVITAICLVFLIGFVALVVDVGHLYSVRNELQNAADAASLAGARALFPTQGYPDATLIPLTEPPYCALAVTAGRQTAASNQAGGITNLTTATDDVQTGIWDWNAKTFTPDATPSYDINAIRSTVRRDSVANQPVDSWFAYILGIDSTPVNAESVAAVGYVNKPIGKVLPIWIPTDIWDVLPTDTTVKANPDMTDKFAWCAPDPLSANASYVKDAIRGVEGTSFAAISEVVNLQNGVDGAAFKCIQDNIDSDSTTYTLPDGTEIEGWYTTIMTGDRLDAAGNEFYPPAGTPLDVKMNKQGNIDLLQPVMITKVENGKGGWSFSFVKLGDATKFVLPGAQPGGPASQLYATQPVLVK